MQADYSSVGQLAILYCALFLNCRLVTLLLGNWPLFTVLFSLKCTVIILLLGNWPYFFLKWCCPMHNSTVFGAYSAHYKHHPIDYKAAVAELLEKAALLYNQRAQPVYGERTIKGSGCNEISRSVYNLRKAALNSNESLRRVAIGPSDHFFLPSSVEYHDNKGVSSIQDEQKDRLVHLQEPPGINAHSVLGKMLFDACVPKNVEDWDIKMVGSLSRPSFGSSRRNSPFNPMKCMRRSRL